MTAEIIIMNREALALAADSAGTISTSKIHFNANKIFTLSKFNPVGIMFYNSSSFMATPWEVVVKEYRRYLKAIHYSSLKEYVDDFIVFLGNFKKGNTNISEHSLRALLNAVNHLFGDLCEVISSLNFHSLDINNDQKKDIIKSIIVQEERKLEKQDYGDLFKMYNVEKINNTYKDIIDYAIKYTEDYLDLSILEKEDLNRIKILLIKLALINSLDLCGIVFAGYGNDEIYPSFYEMSTGGFIFGELLLQEGRSFAIDDAEEKETYIAAFAQADMSKLFMEGIDNDYRDYILKQFGLALKKYSELFTDYLKINKLKNINIKEADLKHIVQEAIGKFFNAIKKYEYDNHIEPILNMLGFLTKEDLGRMAEALISLTSLKRHVTHVAETVGGPIDVAIISKGEGFIWVKRKFYFDSQLNNSFLDLYLKDDTYGKSSPSPQRKKGRRSTSRTSKVRERSQEDNKEQ